VREIYFHADHHSFRIGESFLFREFVGGFACKIVAEKQRKPQKPCVKFIFTLITIAFAYAKASFFGNFGVAAFYINFHTKKRRTKINLRLF